jgi:uncharacterized OB-fold protein
VELIFRYRGLDIQVDELEKPYFQAAASGRLILQECSACSIVRYPTSTRCAACGSDEWVWRDTSGKGKVKACLIVEHGVRQFFQAPYAIGLVELDDLVDQPAAHMVRIMSTILDSDGVDSVPDPLPDGTPVEACYRELAPGYALPEFKVTG